MTAHARLLDSMINRWKASMKQLTTAAILILLLPFSVAFAQPAKLTVGYSSTASAEIPVWLAKETGIFARNGLDIQVVYFRGGTIATMALLSRQTPISQGSGQASVNAALRGADTVMVAGG